MEMRYLGRSGLQVSVLSYGAMSFGGKGYFKSVGETGVEEAARIVGRCIDAGVNLFDTADVYSFGQSEEILGNALGARRKDVLIATKAFNKFGKSPNDMGASRHHLIRACEGSLKRLGTDYIDLYMIHIFDSMTPLEETLRALDDLVRAGKVRYIGCSNFSGWHLMKSLSISERYGLERMVSQQISYSAVGREAEYELVPIALDQGVGILVWGPLAAGLLSGKYRRGAPDPAGARGAVTEGFGKGSGGFFVPDRERIYAIVDVMAKIAQTRGVTVAQVALNYLLAKPAVTSLTMGARNEEQLKDNLAAANWKLDAAEVKEINEASDTPLPYPYDHQAHYGAERNPYWRQRNE